MANILKVTGKRLWDQLYCAVRNAYIVYLTLTARESNLDVRI